VFELDGERLDTSVGTLVFVPPGRKADAIGHLRRSIELSPSRSRDFDAIRDEPAFRELVST